MRKKFTLLLLLLLVASLTLSGCSLVVKDAVKDDTMKVRLQWLSSDGSTWTDIPNGGEYTSASMTYSGSSSATT